jgi:hypothetical protein
LGLPAGPAELAVGDALQAHIAVEPHDLGDRAVFHFAQLGGADLAAGLLLECFEQVGRAEETADMVGAEGRGLAHGVRVRIGRSPSERVNAALG